MNGYERYFKCIQIEMQSEAVQYNVYSSFSYILHAKCESIQGQLLLLWFLYSVEM